MKKHRRKARAQVGEAVLASASAGDNLAAAARLNREQVRAKSKEELLAVVNNENLGEAEKQEAAAAITTMAQTRNRRRLRSCFWRRRGSRTAS